MSPRARRAVAEPIRVLLADDSRVQRDGWALLLGSQPDLEVVAQAGDGAQALAIARRQSVDVILMDVRMPRIGGIAATERLLGDPRVAEQGPLPRVILLATHDLDDHVPAAAAAGAFAVLYKDVEPEALFEAVRQAGAARA